MNMEPTINSLDDDLMADMFKGKLTFDQTIAMRIIRMSVKEYLYFAVGSNGITPEGFLDAYEYLFKVRSNQPTTWGDTSVPKLCRDVYGQIQTIICKIPPEEIKAKCFDTHFDNSGLYNYISMETFLTKLKKKRIEILGDNNKRVSNFIKEFKRKEWNSLPKESRQGKLAFNGKAYLQILSAPKGPKELARLLLFARNKTSESISTINIIYKKTIDI